VVERVDLFHLESTTPLENFLKVVLGELHCFDETIRFDAGLFLVSPLEYFQPFHRTPS
jgi:hypothetical protein